jgi:2'-hydroxyisoflavone reductase
MDVIILGGSRFIGREIVQALRSSGHAVSTFNRGMSSDELPADIERFRGDRNGGIDGLGSLAGRRWDACVDVSGYTARQVRASAEMLRDSVGRYVYISSGAVYGEQPVRPVRETNPRLPPAAEETTEIDGDTYGPLKVLCENIVQGVYADRCTMLRPQIVVGPHDTQRRYSYWAERAMRPGPTLVPGGGSDHLQVIDIRDVAGFVRTVVEGAIDGPFNLAGPRITWAEFVRLLGVKDPVWVPADRLRAAGVTESELPLFRTDGGPSSSKMDVSNEKARSAGLVVSDPQITVRDTQAWLAGREFVPNLSADVEADLIRNVRPLGGGQKC